MPRSHAWHPGPWSPCKDATSLIPSRAGCCYGLPVHPEKFDDLLFVQDEVTYSVLDRYHRLAPGRLKARAVRLQPRCTVARQRISELLIASHGESMAAARAGTSTPDCITAAMR